MSSIKISIIGLILIFFCGNLEASSCHNYFSPRISVIQRFHDIWNRIHFSKLRYTPTFNLQQFEAEKASFYQALQDQSQISVSTPQQALALLEAYELHSRNSQVLKDLRDIESQRNLLLIALSNPLNQPRITQAKLFQVVDIYYLYKNSQDYSFIKLLTDYRSYKNFQEIVRQRWIAESRKLDFMQGLSNLGILQKENISERSFRYLKTSSQWTLSYSFAIWTTLVTGVPAMLPRVSLLSLPSIQRSIMLHNGQIESRSVALAARIQNFYNWTRKIAPYLFASIILYHLPNAPFDMISKFNTPEQNSSIQVIDTLPTREKLEAELLNNLIKQYQNEKDTPPNPEIIGSMKASISKMKLYEISEQLKHN